MTTRSTQAGAESDGADRPTGGAAKRTPRRKRLSRAEREASAEATERSRAHRLLADVQSVAELRMIVPNTRLPTDPATTPRPDAPRRNERDDPAEHARRPAAANAGRRAEACAVAPSVVNIQQEEAPFEPSVVPLGRFGSFPHAGPRQWRYGRRPCSKGCLGERLGS